eukprot:9275387-Pyramimonas_sp.AAC.1
MVSTRVSTTIDARNLRARVNDRLQEAQLKLLNAADNGEETAALREEIARMRALMKVMEANAEEGRAIGGQARQPTQLTPMRYIRKSLESIPKIAKRNAVGNDKTKSQQNIEAFVTLGVLVALLNVWFNLLSS